MLKIIIMIVIGILGGVIGGMGMGGGTLLIPLMIIFTDLNQHEAQCINLVAFIPMSIVALILHFKNKLVKIKPALFISLPALPSSILFAFIAKKIANDSLSVYFGIFLTILGIYQLVCVICSFRKKKEKEKEVKE